MSEHVRFDFENRRLRILVADMYKMLFPIEADRCQRCPRDNRLYPCPAHTVGGGECKFATEVRELGIEAG